MDKSNRMRLRGWGYCICPKCGEKIIHHEVRPCHKEQCPSCGSKMVREGSYHYQLIEQRRNKKITNI